MNRRRNIKRSTEAGLIATKFMPVCLFVASILICASPLFAFTGFSPFEGRGGRSVFVQVITESSSHSMYGADMYGQTHLVTGAYNLTLPAAVIGMSGLFRATTAAQFGIQAGASDGFILYGTAYANGRRILSSGTLGDAVYIECTQANKWDAYPITVFTDGAGL